MKTCPTIRSKSRDDDSMHTHGLRVRAVRNAQRMLSCLVLAVAMAIPYGTLLAARLMPVDLGTAANFGALAGAAITGTGDVEGDVGSGAAIAPAITSTGNIYPMGGAVVSTALADFATAYNDGKNRTPAVVLSAAAYDLGGMTLTPGVYKIGAAATVASPVTIDAEGDPDAVFIIQIGGTSGPSAPYIIESTISLLVPNWQLVGTQERATGTNTWTGAVVLPGELRFFRVIATRDTPTL